MSPRERAEPLRVERLGYGCVGSAKGGWISRRSMGPSFPFPFPFPFPNPRVPAVSVPLSATS